MLYPQEQLFQEMAFLAYYLHGPRAEIMKLPNWERRRWCREVSEVNQKLNGPDKQQSSPLR